MAPKAKKRDKKILTKTPKYVEKFRPTNTFKFHFDDDSVYVHFGIGKPKTKDIIEVTEKARIVFPAQMLRDLIITMYEVGVNYQKEKNKDIGFPEMDKLRKE